MQPDDLDPWLGHQELPGFADDFLAGGGQMGAEIRAFDWSSTSLGPTDSWPLSLKTVTRMVLASKQPISFWWGRELIQIYNDGYVDMLQDRADRALGQPFREIWSDIWEDILPFIREALAGRGTWTENLPLLMTRHGAETETFWTFSYSPLRGDDGLIAGALNVVTETTNAVKDRAALLTTVADLERAYETARRHIEEQKQAEQRQRLLQRELVHRMKNTLSMVQAIVSQTMRHSEDVNTAADIIAGRLAALSRAQDILTETSWKSADIIEVVDGALDPHRDGDARITVAGPRIEMTAQQALGLSLAVHELATNAAKYGALSNRDGKIAIEWALTDDRDFSFRWSEADGPPVATPTRRGFGSRLTEKIVATYFAGQAKLKYDPAGVLFSLDGRIELES